MDATLPTTTETPPRAIGRAEVSAKSRDGSSVLGDLRQSGSMRVLFPRPTTPPTAMLLNTAGGITGGDRFEVIARAGPGAELTVTTQAAERAYRALPDGPPGRVRNSLSVAPGATVRWLPQETILFEGSALDRRLEVDLSGDARALLVEPLVFGRAAHGETLQHARLSDRIAIRRNGRPLFSDAIRLDDDIPALLAHPTLANGAGAMATLIFAAPHAADHLDQLREISAEKTGVCTGISALDPDLLVLRSLAHDSFELRRVLLPVLDHLTGDALPLCWRL